MILYLAMIHIYDTYILYLAMIYIYIFSNDVVFWCYINTKTPQRMVMILNHYFSQLSWNQDKNFLLHYAHTEHLAGK